MALVTSVVLGWLLLAVGALAYAAALQAPPEEAGASGSREPLPIWHRLLCWLAVGWGITLVWIFLDTLAPLVAR